MMPKVRRLLSLYASGLVWVLKKLRDHLKLVQVDIHRRLGGCVAIHTELALLQHIELRGILRLIQIAL